MANSSEAREYVQRLLATKAQLVKLVELEKLLAEHHRTHGADGSPSSVLRSIHVRFKLHGKYLLRSVNSLDAEAAKAGALLVMVQAPEAAAPGAPVPLRRIPVSSVSGTNPLADQHWEGVGRGELAELEGCWRSHGLALPPAEAAAAASRKQAALQWHAEHWQQGQAQQERLSLVPSLLAAVGSASGSAGVQQGLAAEQPPPAVQQEEEPKQRQLYVPQQGQPAQAHAQQQQLAQGPPQQQLAQAQQPPAYQLPAAPASQPPPVREQQQAAAPAPAPVSANGWGAGGEGSRRDSGRGRAYKQLHGRREERDRDRQQERGKERREERGKERREEVREQRRDENWHGRQQQTPAEAVRRAPPADGPRSPRRPAHTARQGIVITLPGAPDLPSALDALAPALRHAIPSSERAAAAKRAVLAAALRHGLLPFGGAEGGFRQLPLQLDARLGEGMVREAASQGGDAAASQLATYGSTRTSQLLNLLQDVGDRRILTFANSKGAVLQVHVDYLAASFLRPGAPETHGGNVGRDKDGSRAAAGRGGDDRGRRSRSGDSARDRERERERERKRGRQYEQERERQRGQSPGEEQPRRRRSPSPGPRRRRSGIDGVAVGRGGERPPRLVPARLRGVSPEWVLIGMDLFISGMHPSVDGDQLKAHLEAAGGTVRNVCIKQGDQRGNIAFAKMESAEEAAQVAERLCMTKLAGTVLVVRESKAEVEALYRSLSPEDIREADRKLADAIAASSRQAIAARAAAAAAAATRRQSPERSPGRGGRGDGEPGGRAGAKRPRSRSRERARASPEARRPRQADRRGEDEARSSGGERVPMRSLPPGAPPAGAGVGRGGSSLADHMYGVFWDPTWQLEWQCLELLQATSAPLPLLQLLVGVDIPPQLGEAGIGVLQTFLQRRSHLFTVGRDNTVAPVAGAEPFLRYKRALLQCLADHLPRVEVGQMEKDVPLPPGMKSDIGALAQRDFYFFLKKYLSDAVWNLSGPTCYEQPRLYTAELKPFDTGPGGPRLAAGPCRFFDGARALRCPQQERCRFCHARPRLFA